MIVYSTRGVMPNRPPAMVGSKLRFLHEAGPTYCYIDNAATLPGVDGNRLRRWWDQSGNGWHIDCANSDTLRLEGGRWYVEVGANGLLFVGGGNPFTGLAAGEIAICQRNTAANTQEGFFFGTGTAGYWPFGAADIYEQFGTDTRKGPYDSTGIDLQTLHVYNVVSASGEFTIRFDNVQLATTNVNAVAWTATNADLGRSGGGVGTPARRIRAAAGFSEVLTAAERAAIAVYLAQ